MAETPASAPAPSAPAKSAPVPSLESFDWRLDVTVGRRALSQIAEPQYALRIKVNDGSGKVTDNWLNADVPTLKHILNELESAARESRTRHARRVFRMMH